MIIIKRKRVLNPVIAIIGTREPTERHKQLIIDWSYRLAKCNCFIKTGATKGIDEAAIIGASRFNARMLHLFLPWQSYGRSIIPSTARLTIFNKDKHMHWIESVKKYHPMHRSLDWDSMCLHARNYGIIMEPKCDLVIALPQSLKNFGGTGQGMRVAIGEKVPMLNVIDQQEEIEKWIQRIEKENR